MVCKKLGVRVKQVKVNNGTNHKLKSKHTGKNVREAVLPSNVGILPGQMTLTLI